MRSPIVTMIHTVFPVVEPLTKLFVSKTKGEPMRIYNVVDDSIIPRLVEAGGLEPSITRTVYEHVVSAQYWGSDVILVTCSSISEIVDVIQPLISVPIVKIDDAMTETAVRIGRRIGVIGSVETALGATIRQLKHKAHGLGEEVEVVPCLCSEAYSYLMQAGDRDMHDQLIVKAVGDTVPNVDVLILAQVSLAHLAIRLEQETGLPVLSSPESAVDRVMGLLRRNETA